MKTCPFVCGAVAALFGVAVAGAVCPAQEKAGAAQAGPALAIVIDCSDSMRQGNRLAEAKHAATLACAILHGRVVLVSFSEDAVVSPVFDLDAGCDEAVRWVEAIAPRGGTKYL